MRRSPFARSCLAVVLLTGCASVIGIDDARVDPTFHPGAAGASSDGGTGGAGGAGPGGLGAMGGMGPAGMGPVGMGPMGPVGMGGMGPAGMGGMGPAGGPGGMGPGMGGGMPMGGAAQGGMGCGTNSNTPVENGGKVVVVVTDCSLKTGSSPHLRIAAHPNNNPMNMPLMPPFVDSNPMFPDTVMLMPSPLGTYAVDALLDYPPYLVPGSMPGPEDATAFELNVVVTATMGANVTLWLH